MSEHEADPIASNLAGAVEGGPMFAIEVPAFVRRGQDVESMLQGLEERCRRHRKALLDMVHVRLRQWEKLATGPDDWRDAFGGPIDSLWGLSGAETPRWAAVAGAARRRSSVARDLASSVVRFNGRWEAFVARLDLRLVDETIDRYNKYYVIEKECVLGSARLAAMHFKPIPRVSSATILAGHPLLPVPEPSGA